MYARLISKVTLCAFLLAAAAFALGATSIQSVQSGSAVSVGNGTVTVGISSLDTTRAFLFLQTRSNSSDPDGSYLSGKIASSTTLEFQQVNDAADTINIEWYVVEYASGVTVQRGEVSQSATTVNVTLPTAVASTAPAFVLWSKRPAAGDVSYGQDDPTAGRLPSNSNLQFKVGTANTNHVIAWQVVKFDDAADVSVTTGTSSILSGTTRNVTIGTVDTATMLVLAGFMTSDSGADVGERTLRAELASSTNILFERMRPGDDDIDEVVYQVIEFGDGTSVQWGNQAFTTGASATVILTVLDEAVSVPRRGCSPERTQLRAAKCVAVATFRSTRQTRQSMVWIPALILMTTWGRSARSTSGIEAIQIGQVTRIVRCLMLTSAIRTSTR
jgi:hypothetical protein